MLISELGRNKKYFLCLDKKYFLSLDNIKSKFGFGLLLLFLVYFISFSSNKVSNCLTGHFTVNFFPFLRYSRFT